MATNNRLLNEIKRVKNEPIENVTFDIDETNILVWKFTLLGPHESPYEGGIYNGIIKFPENYPHKPPTIKFISKLFHPNVYPDGKLCISILHEGADTTNYEHESERWRPVHNVHTIFISIISLLNDSNPDSAANIDAAKLFRENKKEYYLKIKKDMENE
jgi:ubiquitin-protein ligase